jgi:hypothetical protein
MSLVRRLNAKTATTRRMAMTIAVPEMAHNLSGRASPLIGEAIVISDPAC